MSLGQPTREMPLPTSRGGLFVIAAVVGLLLAAASYVTLDAIAIHPVDPEDGGVAEISFFVSPLIAAFCALATGLTVATMAGLRLIPLRVDVAVRSMVIAVVGAPCVYLVGLIIMSGAMTSGVLDAVIMFMVPAVLGTGGPLLLAWDQQRRTRSHQGAATPNQLRHPVGPTYWPKSDARRGGDHWRKAVRWFTNGFVLVFLLGVAANLIAADGLAGLVTFLLGLTLYVLIPVIVAASIAALWVIARAISSR